MLKKINWVVIFLFAIFPLVSFAHSVPTKKPSKKPKWVENVWFDKRTKSLHIGETQITVGAVMECGYYNDQALTASFGLEKQIFMCGKLVFPITMTHGRIFAKFDFAPIYNSIRGDLSEGNYTYAVDPQGHVITGQAYFDWYKNVGTQIYYLGNVPVIDAYVGFDITQHNALVAGRQKNEVGLQDQDTPWDDDGKFAPYSYWLTRDLLTGLMYDMTYQYAGMRAGILSGNNPMKSYANYLGQIQSPNLKANNTPTWTLNFDFFLGHIFNPDNKSKFSIGGMHNMINSTWTDVLMDGKRRNSDAALDLLLDFPIYQNLDINLFSQYSWYLTGLTTDSNQASDGNSRFKNITQSGYFVGGMIHYRWFDLSYTYEYFDRFDANVYANFVAGNFSGYTLAQLEEMKQWSHIINFTYHYNSHIALVLGYQQVQNPLLWVSNILDTYPTYRVKATLLFTF